MEFPSTSATTFATVSIDPKQIAYDYLSSGESKKEIIEVLLELGISEDDAELILIQTRSEFRLARRKKNEQLIRKGFNISVLGLILAMVFSNTNFQLFVILLICGGFLILKGTFLNMFSKP
ncbi:hypothetical protein [Pontibacter sp. G13]|uniref:hypothetical protein n=1 Tax=Pontibacter sp. G13 TaxID=3074898 RepID=UPI00288A995E|nr:hypothetical protein [Pontibacter sp. G13]WNJ17617.1 hypothetical protein RJD25_22430 [Pontibacter sp. G13]